MEPKIGAPVSAHFVNNVLAAAASYIEDDPDYARDVLAELGQFLSYRLRDDPRRCRSRRSWRTSTATCAFSRRASRTASAPSSRPTARSQPAASAPARSSAPLGDALSRRLGEHAGPCVAVLRPGRDGLELVLGAPGDASPERVAIALTTAEECSS